VVLAAHWDGVKWTTSDESPVVEHVWGSSFNDVWAIAYTEDSTLLYHYTGR
jgi:hypothetical protein